jgi:hypothetical protein
MFCRTRTLGGRRRGLNILVACKVNDISHWVSV